MNREVNSEPALQHQCPDPRTESQIELLKKQHQEEIKRKNYDIKKLKEVFQLHLLLREFNSFHRFLLIQLNSCPIHVIVFG